MDFREIKSKITELRLDRRQLAEKAGITYQALCNYLGGFRPMPPRIHEILEHSILDRGFRKQCVDIVEIEKLIDETGTGYKEIAELLSIPVVHVVAGLEGARAWTPVQFDKVKKYLTEKLEASKQPTKKAKAK